MKAEAINGSSTASSAAAGKNNAGTDNISSGDFLMALMGLLQQQGGTENKSPLLDGGVLAQDGGVVAGFGAGNLADLPGLYTQGMFPGAGGNFAAESAGSAKGSIGNLNNGMPVVPLYQLETLVPLTSTQTVIDGQVVPVSSMPGPGSTDYGQAVAGNILQDNAIVSQTASGVPAKGTQPDAQAAEGLQLLYKSDGVNSQMQTVAGKDNASVPELDPILNNVAVQGKVTVTTGVATMESPSAVAQAQSGTVGDQSSLNNFSRPATESITGKEETAVYEPLLRPIEPKHSKYGRPGGQDSNAGAGNNADEQLVTKDKTVSEGWRFEKNEARGHECRSAAEATWQTKDSGGEGQGVSETGGFEVKDCADARTGALGQNGEIQAGPTHIANVTGRRLAAEIIPYIMNVPKNAGGENSRVTTISLKLEPENLGEIKIKLSFAKGELTAHFFTASGLVKDAVESSLPQLRDTLSQHNINLGEATAFVGQEQHNGSGFGGYNQGGSKSFKGLNYPERMTVESGSPVQDNSALDMLI